MRGSRAFRRMASDSANAPLAEPAGTGYSRGLAGRRGHPDDLPGRVRARGRLQPVELRRKRVQAVVHRHSSLALLDPATGDVVLRTPPTVQREDAGVLDVPVTGVAPGTYAAVLTVDGVDSVLERDDAGAITGPLVEVS